MEVVGVGGLLSACLDKGVDITSLLQSRVMEMSVGDVLIFFFFFTFESQGKYYGDKRLARRKKGGFCSTRRPGMLFSFNLHTNSWDGVYGAIHA